MEMSGTTILTTGERDALRHGFQGPRPGSNMFPLLEIRDSDVKISGERIDALLRANVLVATPREAPYALIKGGNAGPPYGEIPDVELTHNYYLALMSGEKSP
jgi:hypothetical protein